MKHRISKSQQRKRTENIKKKLGKIVAKTRVNQSESKIKF